MEIRPTLKMTVAGILMAAVLACAVAVRILFATMLVSAEKEPASAATSSRAEVLREVAKKLGTGEKTTPREFHDFVDAQNHAATTGLTVRQKGPGFYFAGPELETEEVCGSGRTIGTSADFQLQRRLVTVLS